MSNVHSSLLTLCVLAICMGTPIIPYARALEKSSFDCYHVRLWSLFPCCVVTVVSRCIHGKKY